MNTKESEPKRDRIDLQTVWTRHGEQLFAFLLARTRDRDLAQDLVQEIMIRSQEKLSRLRDPEKIVSWLYRVAGNALVDHHRRYRPETTVDLDAWPVSEKNERTREVERMRRELAKCVVPFINRLPEKYRTVVMAVDIERRSQKELANEMDLSYSALKSRVQRGREQLRTIFSRCCAFRFDVRGGIVTYTPKKDSRFCPPDGACS